jgi:predicted nucleic acid-binding protein
LVASEFILDVLSRTFNKPYFRSMMTTNQVDRALSLVRAVAEISVISEDVSGVATHPEDDLVLAAAVSAQADYLVTGDRQVRQLAMHIGVTILSPREFLDVFAAATEPG